METVTDVSVFLARVVREVYRGDIGTKTAGTLIYGCNALRSSLEASDLEIRLKKLEEQLAGQPGLGKP